MKVTATVTGDLDSLPQRFRSLALKAVRDYLAKEVASVIRKGRAEWPVDTGKSSRGIEGGVLLNGGTILIVVRNRVEYAGRVRPTKLGGNVLAWNQYIRVPLLAALQRIRLGKVALDGLRRSRAV